MNFTVGDSLRGAIERLTTQAGVLLIAGVALFSTVQTAAGQDIYAGIVERILDELAEADFRDGLGPNQTELLESVESELEASIADLPLALGLDPGIAAILWILAYVLGLVVLVAALMAFGNRWESYEEFEFDNVGWKVLNLFFGIILFSILVLVGLILLIIPGLILIVVLLFFPAAIALDNESAFSAFSTSTGVVRENILSTLGLIVVGIVVFIVLWIVGWILGGAVSGAGGAVLDEIISAVATVFGAALIAEAYVLATR